MFEFEDDAISFLQYFMEPLFKRARRKRHTYEQEINTIWNNMHPNLNHPFEYDPTITYVKIKD